VFVLIENGGEPPYVDFGTFKTYKPDFVSHLLSLLDVKGLVEHVIGTSVSKNNDTKFQNHYDKCAADAAFLHNES
jgi:hypothetical protein